MHVIFMPYGKIEWVEVFLNDIRAQKGNIKTTSPDGKESINYVTQFQLRVLPFGFYEVVFPKEYRDTILTTLNFPHKDNIYSDRYKIPNFFMKKIREVLQCEEAPTEFDRKEAFYWVKGIDLSHTDVFILPIGIREDIMIADNKIKGWTHEAI